MWACALFCDMANHVRLSVLFLFAPLLLLAHPDQELVFVLDHTNFTPIVEQHPFIVVEFYAPWCGHCKKLAPEYEKAAAILKDNDLPIILAKINADEEGNKRLASEFSVPGFPTLRIIRNNGSKVYDYTGPRDAEGIVSYLKKQLAPPSLELKSAEDALDFVTLSEIALIGVFKSYDSEEFTNFTIVADDLRGDCDWSHTLDESVLPIKDVPLNIPAVRLFKPFDERFSDTSNFSIEGLKKFVDDKSYPLVTGLTQDQSMKRYLFKFFNNPDIKVFLFLNFNDSNADEFKALYAELAAPMREKGLRFLLIDAMDNKEALKHFGVHVDRLPFIMLQEATNKKYALENMTINELKTFFEDYLDGTAKEWVLSEPIPVKNDEPVKIVVRNSIEDEVFKSGKDVLLEFYAPWCAHCKKLAPTLTEVAEHFKDDPHIMIAKMDATKNDVPPEFDVQGFPTIYMFTANKEKLPYGGARTKERFIEFIKEHRSPSRNDGKEQRDEL